VCSYKEEFFFSSLIFSGSACQYHLGRTSLAPRPFIGLVARDSPISAKESSLSFVNIPAMSAGEKYVSHFKTRKETQIKKLQIASLAMHGI
jgi:hypothetical protein